MKNDASLVDTSALDCSACNLPLQAPIYQCIRGHMVCSPCREKQISTGGGKCLCGISIVGLHMRCHAMERLARSVRVPCVHAAHGCAATTAYGDHHGHLEACPYAPYVCPVTGCDFAGAVGPLMDHLAAAHSQVDAVKQFLTQELGNVMARLQMSVAAHEAEEDAGMERKIDAVMVGAGVSRAVAVRALEKNGGDRVRAINQLTN